MPGAFRLLAFFLTCGGLMLLSCCTTSTEHSSTPADSVKNLPDSVHYAIPSELPVDTLFYKRDNDPYAQFRLSRFYPVGWSDDGCFAYAQVMFDTTLDGEQIEVVIKDENSDNARWSIQGRKRFVADGNAPLLYPGTIDEFWKDHYKEIAAALWKYRIRAQPSGELLPFSHYLQDQLSVRGEVAAQVMKHHAAGYEYWPEVKLWLLSENSGKEKLFYDRQFGGHGPEWSAVKGYLPSPDKRRIALPVELFFHGVKKEQISIYDAVVVDPSGL